jgi:hypothetical protein
MKNASNRSLMICWPRKTHLGSKLDSRKNKMGSWHYTGNKRSNNIKKAEKDRKTKEIKK